MQLCPWKVYRYKDCIVPSLGQFSPLGGCTFNLQPSSHKECLREGTSLYWYTPIFQRETTFAASCLLSWPTKYFTRDLFLKEITAALAISLLDNKGKQQEGRWVASLVGITIHRQATGAYNIAFPVAIYTCLRTGENLIPGNIKIIYMQHKLFCTMKGLQSSVYNLWVGQC